MANDDLTTRRQRKCAESREGHDFDQGGHGICRHCGLEIKS